MYIAIPFEGRVRTLIRSSFVLAKRLSETTYNLSGDAFQMTQVTAEQALVFPDEVSLEEGTALTDELLMQALPLESFVSVSADEALPNVLGLLLRTAVADGRISDEELLSVQPALKGRNWHANIAVQVGDVLRVLPGETVPVDGVILTRSVKLGDLASAGTPMAVLLPMRAVKCALMFPVEGVLLYLLLAAVARFLLSRPSTLR